MRNKFITAISIIEMIGGVLGFFLSIYLFLSFVLTSGFENDYRYYIIYIFIIGFIVLYILSFIGGLFLFKNKPKGIIISIIVQAFQLPIFIIGGIKYLFASGLRISVIYTMNLIEKSLNFNLDFNLGSSCHIYFLDNKNTIQIGINLFALIILLYLIKYKNQINKNTIITQLD